MKKNLLTSLLISAFLVFFCWGFPALRGVAVNWLHAALTFIGVTVVGLAIGHFSSGALTELFEKDGKLTQNDEKK